MTETRSHEQTGYAVNFKSSNKQVTSLPGETLLDCARRTGVRIASVCGGRGLCKTCVIQITDGEVDLPSEADEKYFTQQELDQNWRRACQTFIAGDCVVEVPERAQAVPMRTLVAGEDIYVQPDPVVRSFSETVYNASLEMPEGDDVRLKNVLNKRWPGAGHHIDYQVQKELPRLLRELDTRVNAISRFGEIIGVIPPKKGPLLGLAIDIGTTNIGVLLIDLRTGKTLKSMGLENPQGLHGADVISRLSYARHYDEAPAELQKLVVDGINTAAEELTSAMGYHPGLIADVVMAGNTVMHHMVAGLPIDYLAMVPFIPAVSGSVDIKARELGLVTMPGAYVHLLPNIAGFVGGDHTAVLLAIGSGQEKQTVIVLDIGTNTEISLIHEGRVSSISCPSGPALEGGHITCGMRSAPGAIEAVKINGEKINIRTIDNVEPVGICGTGVLDICAELYKSNITSSSGRMDINHPRVRQVKGKRELEFVLVDEQQGDGNAIVFTQGDVRAVQLAKGAIRAGIDILLSAANIEEKQINQVIIAGAFGNYIDIKSAINIGMLPDLPNEHYAQIGNAAGMGAKLALVSHNYRTEAEAIARDCEYIELSGSSSFNSAFMISMSFPINKNQSTPEVTI